MNIPKDPFLLLSFINTKLRDEYSSLDELCDEMSIDKDAVVKTLETIDYRYNSDKNSFC